MKKIFLSLILLCAVSLTGFAASKFYINPGHGGHDSDDRPTPLPLGVEIFYESDGSLDRGFSLRDFFNGLGCQTAMSRTTNNSSDDLSLATICAYSNSFGGYFISLHTNGANASSNYTVAFYKGYSADYPNTYAPGSTMAQKVADWHYNNHMTSVTYSTPRGLSDYSFYGYHLGVLRTNTRPGYLVESWFHDYRPDALRMKSTLFNRYIAWQVCRASFDSPGGIPNTLKGCIVGDIRDVSKGCGYSNYTARDRDSKLAINDATVKLLNANGVQVASCSTGNCCNGFYGFYNVDPGNYTVVVSKSGYKTQRVGVSVSNMSSTKRNFDLQEGQDTGISTEPSSLGFGTVTIGTNPTKNIAVTGYGLSSNISISNSDNTNFAVSTTSLGTGGGTLTVTYKPQNNGNHSTTITLRSGSYSATVNVSGSAVWPPLSNVNEKWNVSDKRGNISSKGYDANKIRNFAYNDGKLYCVYNHSDILVLNAQTGESLGTLNLGNVVSGGTLKLCDVKVLDGHVVACNLAASGQELRLYAWDNDQSEPYLLYNTTEMNGAARIGDCMELAGKYDSDLYITFGNDNGGVTRIIQYRRNSGNWSTQVYEVQKDGKQYATGSTTRVYSQPGNGYWVDGKNSYPAWTTLSGNVANVGCTVDTGKLMGSSHHEFNFKGRKYAANLVFSGDANYTKPQMRIIIDETGNFSQTTLIGYYPSDGLSDQVCGNTGACGDCAINTDGTNFLEAWVLSYGQGIAYYTHGTVPAQNPDPIGPAKPAIKAASSVSFETFKDGFAEQKLKITGVALEQNIKLSISGDNAAYFSLSDKTLSKDGGEISIYYAPKAVGSHTARLTASSEGADDVVIELKGTAKTPTQFVDKIDALTEMWNKSGSNVEASWVNASENYIRNIAYQDGKIYMVLCKPWGKPEIKILDAYTGDVKGSLNMEGVSGGTAAISGIVAVGGKIFASNIATTAQVFRIYRWDSDGAAPAVALEIAGNGHATSAIGGQLSFSGDLNNGRFWSSDNSTNNLIYFNVSGGNINSTVNKLALKNGDKAFTVGDGRGTASVQVASDGTLYVASKDAYPAHFKADGTMIEQLQASACGNVLYGAALNVFTFGSKRYAVAGTYAEAGSTKKGAFTLINITDGFAAAESPIGMYPAAGFSSDNANDQRLQSVAVSTRENGHVLDVWFATSKQGLGYYSYNGIKPADAIEDVISETPEAVLLYTGTEIQVEGVQAANIAVYSITGALVRNESNSNIVNVEGLHGVYIAVVVDTEGNTFTKKFVLK